MVLSNGDAHNGKFSWAADGGMEGSSSGLQRGAANVPKVGITRPAHDLAGRLRIHGLFACLLEQLLEVLGADAVVATHGGDGSADVLASQGMAGATDFLGARGDQTHGATDMGVDVRVERTRGTAYSDPDG